MRHIPASLTILVLGLAGCGKKADLGGNVEERHQKSELQEIGLLFELFQTAKGRPAAKLADLSEYEVGYPNGYHALRTGECVAFWAIDLPKAGTAAVLAYRKDVPKEGGLVLMADQTVKTMTAEDFKASAKVK